MDRTMWTILVAAVDAALALVPAFGRRPIYSDRLIVLLTLWAVWHDRCLSWACDKDHYGNLFRPRKRPSISQFIRRVKTERIDLVLQRIHNDLRSRGIAMPFDGLSYIDGKPVLVSGVSKDPEAKRGKAWGGFAKGYKFHAYVNEHRRVMVWIVTPLNGDEKTMAHHMVEHLPPGVARADTPSSIARSAPMTLGDANYDSSPLHRDFEAIGRTLFTPLRGEKFVGAQGRSEKTLAAIAPTRRDAIDLWEDRPELATLVLKARNNIEGTFSVLSLALGLDRLPGHVRRLPRVRRWIGCKVILYHARASLVQA